MKSLKELYRIGKGPSSSHTMGPQRAAKLFMERCANASTYEVTLYGSLAATGKGHMTDVAIEEVFRPHKLVHIIWEPQTFLPFHPNGMKFVGKDLNGDIIEEWTVYSIGGGALSDGTDGHDELGAKDIYDLNTMHEIQQWCYDNGRAFWKAYCLVLSSFSARLLLILSRQGAIVPLCRVEDWFIRMLWQ